MYDTVSGVKGVLGWLTAVVGSVVFAIGAAIGSGGLALAIACIGAVVAVSGTVVVFVDAFARGRRAGHSRRRSIWISFKSFLGVLGDMWP